MTFLEQIRKAIDDYTNEKGEKPKAIVLTEEQGKIAQNEFHEKFKRIYIKAYNDLKISGRKTFCGVPIYIAPPCSEYEILRFVENNDQK